MATITVAEMKRWANKRIKEGIKPATCNRQRAILQSIINHAVQAGVLESNPIASWKRLPVEDSSRVRWLGSNDEHERFKKGERERFMEALATMPADIQAIVRTAMLTGMRRGEIFSLRWCDVDFKTGTITIEGSNTKTRKSRRIPINSSLEGVLRSWRGDVIQFDPNARVFPSTKTGGRRSDIKKQWAKLVKTAKIRDFHFHDCRHDAASKMVQKGVPIATVSKILGHSSIQITEQVYAHLAPEHLRNALEVLA
jgi:integrase